MRTCNYCGKENDDTSVNCAGCGCSLVKPDDKFTEDAVRNFLRAISCLIGILSLIGLVLLVVHGDWKILNLKGWISSCAVIGLFLGYGFGGNVWGARLFDFFTGQNVRSTIEKGSEKPKRK